MPNSKVHDVPMLLQNETILFMHVIKRRILVVRPEAEMIQLMGTICIDVIPDPSIARLEQGMGYNRSQWTLTLCVQPFEGANSCLNAFKILNLFWELLNQYSACLYLFECFSCGDYKYCNKIQKRVFLATNILDQSSAHDYCACKMLNNLAS